MASQHTDVKLHLEMGGEHPAHLGLDFVQGLVAADDPGIGDPDQPLGEILF